MEAARILLENEVFVYRVTPRENRTDSSFLYVMERLLDTARRVDKKLMQKVVRVLPNNHSMRVAIL